VRCPEKMMEAKYDSIIPAFPSRPQSSGIKGRTGHLRMTQLNHVEMQDCLSRYAEAVQLPVWQRSLHSTQRLPVMGLAARVSWISQGTRHGNALENQTLRGRETVLEALVINCEDMRMLSARTGDKLRAVSQTEEILGWRAVYAERCTYGSGRGTRHTRKGQRSLLYA